MTADGLDPGGRYRVERIGPSSGRHRDCWKFVLDVDHDPYAVQGLLAYADACEAEDPGLAYDLRMKAANGEVLQAQAEEPAP